MDLKEQARQEYEELKREFDIFLEKGRRKELEMIASFDLETTGLSNYRDKIVGFSVAWFDPSIGYRAWYVDTAWEHVPLLEAREFIFFLLSQEDLTLVGNNIKFDLNFCIRLGAKILCKTINLSAMQAVIDERESKELKDMAKLYLGKDCPKFKDVRRHFKGILHYKFREYGRTDALIGIQVFHKMRDRINKLSKYPIHSAISRIFELVNDQTMIAAEMERNGFYLDADLVEKEYRRYKKLLAEQKAKIYETAGYEFKISSGDELAIAIEKMGIDLAKYDIPFTAKVSNATGQARFTVNKKFLETVLIDCECEGANKECEKCEGTGEKYEPFIDLVLTYTKYFKLLTAFFPALRERCGQMKKNTDKELGRDDDGRVRSSFNTTRAATARWSSSDPNQQQVPLALRKLFIASPGHTLICADFSQLELRLIAIVLNEEVMLNAFRQGKDVHQETANLLGIDRKIAKNGNFSLVYMAGVDKFSRTAGVTKQEARKFIKMFKENYPSITKFHKDSQNKLNAEFATYNRLKTTIVEKKALLGIWKKDLDISSGDVRIKQDIEALSLEIEELEIQLDISEPHVRNIFGRIRRLGKEKNAITAYCNTKIQMSGADLMNLALRNIWRRRQKDPRLANLSFVAQVHDEVVLEFPDTSAEDLDYVKGAVKEEMENSVTLKIPFTASVKNSYNWEDAK